MQNNLSISAPNSCLQCQCQLEILARLSIHFAMDTVRDLAIQTLYNDIENVNIQVTIHKYLRIYFIDFCEFILLKIVYILINQQTENMASRRAVIFTNNLYFKIKNESNFL